MGPQHLPIAESSTCTPFSGQSRPTKRTVSRGCRLRASLQEALIDSVVERVTARGRLGVQPPDAVGDEAAAGEHHRRLAQPRADHRRVEVGERVIVHVQDDLRRGIGAANGADEVGDGVQVDDVAAARTDVARDLVRIVGVIDRAQPERPPAIVEPHGIEHLQPVERAVDPDRNAPVGDTLVRLDLLLPRHPFRIGDDFAVARQTAADLVVDDGEGVVEPRVRQGDVGVWIDLCDSAGHTSD